jgi:hypothetical protein
MGNTQQIVKIDIDKRPMAKYYGVLSSLYLDRQKQEINL